MNNNKQPLQTVAVIGLGSMGMGAAQSCIRAGLKVYGIDLDPGAQKTLLDAGAAAVGSDATEFAHKIDAVLLLLVNAAQVKAVLFGDCQSESHGELHNKGLATKLKPGTAVMVSSTISVEDAKDIARQLQALDLLVLDAPVSGGAAKAAKGEMTVMAAGSDSAFEYLQALLDAVATKVYRIGSEPGKGATVKIIHQLLAGVHIAAGAEAMALAARAQIPLDLMYEVVTHAAGNSWMFENRMAHVVAGDYSPTSMVDIFVKDLGLVSDTGKALDFELPLTQTALAMFRQASAEGYGQQDDSAVIKIFKGIELPEEAVIGEQP